MIRERWWWAGLVMAGVVMWMLGIYRLDPDFGWHLKVGEILLTEGIPATDPFSYTMPSFPWVDHGRVTDMAMAWLYPRVGMTGLAGLAAVVVLAAVVIVVPGTLRGWSAAFGWLALAIFVPRAGVRPQVEDWLFVAILVRLLWQRQGWRKWRWVVPVIFAIWANLHGGWPAGLVIVGVWLAAGWGETVLGGEKVRMREVAKDLAVWGMSAATGMNPYGFRLWEEVWLTVSDTNLRWNIAEWNPFFLNFELGFGMLAVWLVALWRIAGKNLGWSKVAVVGILGLAGAASLRNQGLLAITVIPVGAELTRAFWDKLKGDRVRERRTKVFLRVVLVVVGMAAGVGIGEGMWQIATGGGEKFYPAEAARYVAENKVEGRLLAEYGWGGYLIWKLPERKLFIDGRMPSWRWEAPEGESSWAFEEYLRVERGEWEEVFAKYGVEAVMWPVARQSWLENAVHDLMVKVGWEKTGGGKRGLVKSLTEKGWREIYRDGTAVVLVGPK